MSVKEEILSKPVDLNALRAKDAPDESVPIAHP